MLKVITSERSTMNKLKEIGIQEFNYNPFEMIGKDWMLITAQKDGKVNTMTASWGGLGVIWNCNVAYIFVRQSRYTKEFIDSSDSFSLTFYDTEKYRKALAYLGSVSGRDENKIEKAGLTIEYTNGIPYFNEAKTVILCKKLSRHYLSPEGFISESVDSQYYKDKDYHDMYIGEIIQILKE